MHLADYHKTGLMKLTVKKMKNKKNIPQLSSKIQ